MTHPDAESLIDSYQMTQQIVKLQTEGLRHADSLLQLPFRGNCMNWVLGHIVVGRNRVLRYLGESPIWEEEISRYETGSEPITTDDQALPLEKLLSALDQSQAQIRAALERTSPEELAAAVEFRGSEHPLGQVLSGLHWHETYHTGQLEILRQLAGKNDAII